jgi:hypothetical protein
VLASPQGLRLSSEEKRAGREQHAHIAEVGAKTAASRRAKACTEYQCRTLDWERIGWLGAFGMTIYGPTNHWWFNFQERYVTAFKSRSIPAAICRIVCTNVDMVLTRPAVRVT